MTLSITVKIITPEKIEFQGESSMVVLPGSLGDIGVLPRHECLATSLRAGSIQITKEENNTQTFVVGGGFAHVTPTSCTILVPYINLVTA